MTTPVRASVQTRDDPRGVTPANLAGEGNPIGLTAEAGGGFPTLRAWAPLAGSARPNHGLTTVVTGLGLRYPVEISENSRFSGVFLEGSDRRCRTPPLS